MRRRSLFCELFIEADRAEDRAFHQRLEVPELLARRSEILSALMSLVRHWESAGRPKPSRSHSSFPEWADIIGGIVENAGYGCPLETAKLEAAADADGADMGTLVGALANGGAIKSVTFDDLLETALQHGLFETILPDDEGLDRSARAKLGNLLRSYDRRLIGGFRFSLEGRGRNRRYRVEKQGA